MRFLRLFVCKFLLFTIGSSAKIFVEPSFEPVLYESPESEKSEITIGDPLSSIDTPFPTNLPESEILIELDGPLFASPIALPEWEEIEPEVTPFLMLDDLKRSNFSFNIDVTHKQPFMAGTVDSAIKSASARFTGTEISDWKMVSAKVLESSPSPSPETVIQDNGPPSAGISNTVMLFSSNSDNSEAGSNVWRTVYQANIAEESVPAYEKYVSSGSLAKDIQETENVGYIRASLLAPASKISPRIETVPKVAPVEEEKLPPPVSGETEQNAGGGRNIAVLGLSLVAGIAAIVAVAGMAVWAVRRRNMEEQILPPSDSCSLSAAAAEQRTTSVGPPPRGTDALRAHAGILSWQEDAAAEAQSLPLSPPPPPPPPGATYVRQNQPAPYVPKVNSKGSGSSSSAFAPNTGTTSSAYNSGTPRTSSEDGTVESSEIIPDSETRTSDAITSEASTAFALGITTPRSITPQELIAESPSPTQHTFVNFGEDYSDPKFS